METTLADLLGRNAAHAASLPADHFDAVADGQAPAAVSICCADSRVSQERMWAVEEPGWLFTPSTIGNVAWDRVDGERVVDGSVCYPLALTGTRTALVVGHTGCGAVTAALAAVRDGPDDLPRGVGKWVDELVPVVEDGLADPRVDPDASLVDQLVEVNVDRQVAFLRGADEVPDDTAVYGFVYDLHGVYGDDPGRAYLVNADGERDPAALRDLVPDRLAGSVARLVG
jgi:carbonic anhydrase